MNYSDYKESRNILQEKVMGTYGTISKYDMKEFINFLQADEELQAEGWGLGEPLPLDLEELIDQYIEQEDVYRGAH